MSFKITMTNSDGTDFIEGNMRFKASIQTEDGKFSAIAVLPEELVDDRALMVQLQQALCAVALDRSERLGQIRRARRQFLEEREVNGHGEP